MNFGIPSLPNEDYLTHLSREDRYMLAACNLERITELADDGNVFAQTHYEVYRQEYVKAKDLYLNWQWSDLWDALYDLKDWFYLHEQDEYRMLRSVSL